MNAGAVAATLDRPSGFALVMKGMFRGGRGKQAHAIWTAAQRKGVHETVELRFVTHESYGYAVLAFSVDGPLDPGTRRALVVEVDRFSIRTIRYEAVMYSAMTPLGWHPRAYDPYEHSIDAIAGPFAGVHVFTAITSQKGADKPLVAHCVVDGRNYIYPLPGDRLRLLPFLS